MRADEHILSSESDFWWAERTSHCVAELQAKEKKSSRHSAESSEKLTAVILTLYVTQETAVLAFIFRAEREDEY